MLDAFRIKPFDLLPIYEEWQDGPYFNGNPKDISVEEWLNKIKEGCIKRSVPEEYWYKVAQHFMGPRARARPVGFLSRISSNLTVHHRLDELKQVIHKVHGGTYRWTWKKFRIALLNMGCTSFPLDIRTSQPLTQSWKGKSTKTRRRRSVSRPNPWVSGSHARKMGPMPTWRKSLSKSQLTKNLRAFPGRSQADEARFSNQHILRLPRLTIMRHHAPQQDAHLPCVQRQPSI